MRLCREGFPFILGCAAFAALCWIGASAFHSMTAGFFAGMGVLATLFCLRFFRDPIRQAPSGDGLILSPADGVITEIVESSDSAWTGPVSIVRIFLSVFDVHLQRTPVPGTIRKLKYTAGKFFDARDPKAAFENEQNRIEIEAANPVFGGPIVVTQIAGLIARRIVCDVHEGQSISTAQRLGLIRFGSQVNLVVPRSATMCVKSGDRVKTGETIIAKAGN